MTVTIKLFAVLRELAGEESFQVVLENGAGGADVLKAVGQRFPVLTQYLDYVRLATPEKYIPTGAPLDATNVQEIYVIPPVSGG
jgi:molybdopterin converting factor small subunit